jgi:hypothetical protein
VKPNVTLTILSLLSITLMTIHLTDDILCNLSSSGLANLFAVFIFAAWLYGTLVLADRRTGQVIMLLGSLFGLVAPVVHMKGVGGLIGAEIGTCSSTFRFVWTLIALGVTAMVSAAISARALWSLPWRHRR